MPGNGAGKVVQLQLMTCAGWFNRLRSLCGGSAPDTEQDQMAVTLLQMYGVFTDLDKEGFIHK